MAKCRFIEFPVNRNNVDKLCINPERIAYVKPFNTEAATTVIVFDGSEDGSVKVDMKYAEVMKKLEDYFRA